MRTSFAAAFISGLALSGCSDRPLEVGEPLALVTATNGSAISVADCPARDLVGMDHACVIGSDGSTHVTDGTMWVLPAEPPYSFYVRFSDDAHVPPRQNVTTTGERPSVTAWAARANIDSCDPLPEGDLANQIATRVAYPTPRGLLVIIDDPVAAPIQVSIALDFLQFYAGESSLAESPGAGYIDRFYVGAPPPTPPNPNFIAQRGSDGSFSCTAKDR